MLKLLSSSYHAGCSLKFNDIRIAFLLCPLWHPILLWLLHRPQLLAEWLAQQKVLMESLLNEWITGASRLACRWVQRLCKHPLQALPDSCCSQSGRSPASQGHATRGFRSSFPGCMRPDQQGYGSPIPDPCYLAVLCRCGWVRLLQPFCFRNSEKWNR